MGGVASFLVAARFGPFPNPHARAGDIGVFPKPERVPMTRFMLGVLLLTGMSRGCGASDPPGIDDGVCPNDFESAVRAPPIESGCVVVEGMVRDVNGDPAWGTRVTPILPDSIRPYVHVDWDPGITQRDGRYRMALLFQGFRDPLLDALEMGLLAEPFTTARNADRDTAFTVYITARGAQFEAYRVDIDLDVPNL